MIPQWASSPVNDGTWFALGVVATLFYTYVTHRIGRGQIGFLRKSHDLNIRLAECQVGTECAIGLRPFNESRPDVRRYVIETRIYNAGDLAAKNVKGTWSMTCSDSIYNHSFPIRVDYVTKAKCCDLEPYSLGTNEITQAISNGNAWVKVYIEFEFTGLEDQEKQHYSAKYERSHYHKQMIRID